jgi:molybdate/tungstate transport system ATP-binding protein
MVSLKNLYYKVGSFCLDKINLDIKKNEYFVILGPSGNGKTQLLRCIAGLCSIQDGEIFIDGKRKDQLPPEKRSVGMVFQNHILFPNMSVFDNIAFSLKLKKMNKNNIKDKVNHVAKIVGIDNLLSRSTVNLSGGERQRVALARAIVFNPKVLLMDEPFASLDKNLAEKLIIETKDLHKMLKQTTIHVTHNQEEAFTLADRICILKNGKIQMIDTPDNIFHKPNSQFIANFVCIENIYSKANIDTNGWISYHKKKISFHGDHQAKKNITFCIRPEDTLLERNRINGENVFRGNIQEIYDKGSIIRAVVDIGFRVVNLTMRNKFSKMNVNKGAEIYIKLPEKSIHII